MQNLYEVTITCSGDSDVDPNSIVSYICGRLQEVGLNIHGGSWDLLDPIDDNEVAEKDSAPRNSEAKEDLLGCILGTPLSKDFLKRLLSEAYEMNSK